MKNILYKILPVCLLTIGLTGCEDETKYRPLPEAVPLTMSINEKAFVMGEHLKVDIKVEPDADGNEVVANEDFDIYFTAKAGTEDVANVFEPFSSIVTFPKGEKQIQVDFPVKTSGLVGTTTMEFVAFARGYKMANSSQGIKVSDYYRISMSLENNTENVVTEGGKFVLVAKVDKPSSVPLEVTITPKEGEEGSVGSAAGRLLMPMLSDKIGRRPTDLLLFAVSLGLSAGFAFAQGWWVIACYAGLTFCYSGLAAVLPALSTDLFGLPHAGVNYGFLALGQSVGSLAFPFAANLWGLEAGRHWLAVGGAAAGFAAMWVLKPAGQTPRRQDTGA